MFYLNIVYKHLIYVYINIKHIQLKLNHKSKRQRMFLGTKITCWQNTCPYNIVCKV